MPGEKVQLAIRPESIVLQHSHEQTENNTLNNVVSATIDEIEFLGSFERVYLDVGSFGKSQIMVDVPNSVARQLELDARTDINIHLPEADIRVYADDA